MTLTNSQKKRKRAGKGKGPGKVRSRKLLDGISVSVGMPGSVVSSKPGNVTSSTSIASRRSRRQNILTAPAAYAMGDMTVPAKFTSNGDGARITGCDLIGNVTIQPGQNTVGVILYETLITPYMLPGSRLSNVAPLFQKYRIKRLTFKYITAVGSSTTGQLIDFYDYDPSNQFADLEDPTSGVGNITIASAHTRSCAFSPWQPHTLTYGSQCPWLFTNDTGEDSRLSQAGQYVLMLAAPTTSSDDAITLGALYMDYDFEFMKGDAAAIQSGSSTGPYTAITTALGTVAQPLFGGVFTTNQLGLTLSNPTGSSQVDWPTQLGNEIYLMVLAYSSTASIANPGVSSPLLTNATLTTLQNQLTRVFSATTPTAVKSSAYLVLIEPLGPGPMAISFSVGGTGGTSADSGTLYIFPVPRLSRLPSGRQKRPTKVDILQKQVNYLRDQLTSLAVTVSPPPATTMGGPVLTDFKLPPDPRVDALIMIEEFGAAVAAKARMSTGIDSNVPNFRSRCLGIVQATTNRWLTETGKRHFCQELLSPTESTTPPKSCQDCSRAICDYIRMLTAKEDLDSPVKLVQCRLPYRE